MPHLRLDSVGKTYAADGGTVVALDNVSLSLEAGQYLALTGRSGCGKTTLLNLCGAMDFPSSGRVHIGEVCTSELDEAGLTKLRRGAVGFVFQSFQLLPALSVVENVELPLLLAGASSARKRALEALEWVEMAALAARAPHQLSGGQMQRVAVARALVHGPGLVLADEPTGNLDTATGAMVLELLRRAARERNAAVVMATHSLEAAGVCDRVIRLRDGRIEP